MQQRNDSSTTPSSRRAADAFWTAGISFRQYLSSSLRYPSWGSWMRGSTPGLSGSSSVGRTSSSTTMLSPFLEPWRSRWAENSFSRVLYLVLRSAKELFCSLSSWATSKQLMLARMVVLFWNSLRMKELSSSTRSKSSLASCRLPASCCWWRLVGRSWRLLVLSGSQRVALRCAGEEYLTVWLLMRCIFCFLLVFLVGGVMVSREYAGWALRGSVMLYSSQMLLTYSRTSGFWYLSWSSEAASSSPFRRTAKSFSMNASSRCLREDFLVSS